jgi:undecaprenyl-diphosphatase
MAAVRSPGPVDDATLSRSRRALRGAATAVAVAVPIALLALLVREQFNPLIRFDEGVIRWATDVTRSAGLAPVLVAVQEATTPVVVHVLASLVAVWVFVARGLRSRAVWAFATLMVGWFLGYAVKLVVQRARPVVDDPVSHAPGYSFPSGHATNIAVVTSVLVFLLWPLLSRVWRRAAVATAVAVAVVVGLDRVFLGVHFPSDVLAGLILGVGITFSSWIGFIGKTAVTSSPGPSAPASSSGG